MTNGQPRSVPTISPSAIMSDISVAAVTMAGRPTVVSLSTLNSNPRPNMRNMTPMSDHVVMLAVSTTVGTHTMAGPTRKPAST